MVLMRPGEAWHAFCYEEMRRRSTYVSPASIQKAAHRGIVPGRPDYLESVAAGRLILQRTPPSDPRANRCRCNCGCRYEFELPGYVPISRVCLRCQRRGHSTPKVGCQTPPRVLTRSEMDARSKPGNARNATEETHTYAFSDGAAIGNPGPGGYGVVLKYRDARKELSRGFRLTTNNRMELLGAIVALETLRRSSRVTLATDSRYVVDGISEGWAEEWRAAGWRRGRERKVEASNPDLWSRLLDLVAKHRVQFEWVKGHTGHPENERCDRLANEAAHGDDLSVDEMYERSAAR